MEADINHYAGFRPQSTTMPTLWRRYPSGCNGREADLVFVAATDGLWPGNTYDASDELASLRLELLADFAS